MQRFLVYAVTFCLAVVSIGGAAQAQNREVTGRVTVGVTGRPLADALIGVLGEAQGVRTNDRGEFRITVPPGDVTLYARSIGYKRVTRRVASSSARVLMSSL